MFYLEKYYNYLIIKTNNLQLEFKFPPNETESFRFFFH